MLGVVQTYTEFGSALLVADNVAFGEAHVVVTDEAVPNVKVGDVLSSITVNVLAVLVSEETQPVIVLVIANVYTPAAVKVADA